MDKIDIPVVEVYVKQNPEMKIREQELEIRELHERLKSVVRILTRIYK